MNIVNVERIDGKLALGSIDVPLAPEIEELGSESFVHVNITHEGNNMDFVVQDAGETQIQRGDNVKIQITGQTHVFAAAGERVGD